MGKIAKGVSNLIVGLVFIALLGLSFGAGSMLGTKAFGFEQEYGAVVVGFAAACLAFPGIRKLTKWLADLLGIEVDFI